MWEVLVPCRKGVLMTIVVLRSCVDLLLQVGDLQAKFQLRPETVVLMPRLGSCPLVLVALKTQGTGPDRS